MKEINNLLRPHLKYAPGKKWKSLQYENVLVEVVYEISPEKVKVRWPELKYESNIDKIELETFYVPL